MLDWGIQEAGPGMQGEVGGGRQKKINGDSILKTSKTISIVFLFYCKKN